MAIGVGLALACALSGCPDSGGSRTTRVKCSDGTVVVRDNKGSVVCRDHGGEAWR